MKLSLGLAVLSVIAAAAAPFSARAQLRTAGSPPAPVTQTLPQATRTVAAAPQANGYLYPVTYMRPSILPEPARVILQRRSQLPVGSLHDFYVGKFAEAKAGNADAIYQLGLVLQECAQFDATPQALKTSIQRVRQTGQMNGMATDPAWAATELQRRYNRCEGISAQARSRYWEVLVKAAEQGSVEALESMAFQLPPSDICRERELYMCDRAAQSETLKLRQQQAAWLHKAQQAGSVNALWLLGAAYLNGEMAAPDKSEAYVYLRAYQMVAEAFQMEIQAERLISDLKQALGPAAVARAEARAVALVNDPDCCVYIR